MRTSGGAGLINISGVRNPFMPSFEADANGDLLAFGNTRNFNIDLIDSHQNRIVRIVRRANASRPLTAAHRDAWVKETNFDNPSLPTRLWSVFDSAGVSLGTIAIPTNLEVFEIGEDYLLGVWTDDLDIEYVRMYDLVARTN